MKLAKALICLSACALVAGCNKESNTNNNRAANASNPANMTASPKATVEAAKSPAETGASAAKVSKPEDAAKGLFEAWKTKDRTAASKFAADSAIKSLFSEGGPEGLQFQGCNKSDAGGYECAYSYEGGGLIMHVAGSESDGYKVVTTGFIAD
jgi:membrane protein involved in colicin uptake